MSGGDSLRNHIVRLALLGIALAIVSLGQTAIAAPAEQLQSAPGEIVVQLGPENSSLDAKRLSGRAHGTVERVLPDGFLTLSVEPGREDVAIEGLLADPAVISAERNAVRQPHAIPSDELYPRQWNMAMIQAPQAWGTTLGADITVAVLDTGVAFEDFAEFGRSPQLAKTQFVFPYDATTGSNHPNDRDGHGTHVTGTLVQDWDAIETAGLVPLAAIIPVRVCDASACKADALAAGIRWAVDHGADIINISLGGPTPTQVERDALAYAERKRVLVVASVGNGGSDLIGDPQLNYPARYETVVAVGAVDRLKGRAGYSNYGDKEGTAGVHVMGPGGNRNQDLDGDGFDDGILQNTYAFTCSDQPLNYEVFQACSYYGTSMASPHVAGIAAMILSEYPGLSPAEVRQVLACSAMDLGPEGDDESHGSGLVQAADALIDIDKNGVPDCLDTPPTFSISVDDVKVLPGATFQLSVEGSVPYPGLLGYEIVISYEPAVAEVVACMPRPETTCEQLGNQMFLSSEPLKPVWGNFRVAHIEMLALGNLNNFTSVSLQVQALSARTPDLGLNIVRDAGSIRIADPLSSVFGDLNCDNVINSTDVIIALRRGNAVTAPCNPLGDVDCNGTTDAWDGIALIAYLAGVARPQPANCPPIGLSAGKPPPEP